MKTLPHPPLPLSLFSPSLSPLFSSLLHSALQLPLPIPPSFCRQNRTGFSLTFPAPNPSSLSHHKESLLHKGIMIGPDFAEEIDGSFFDQIDDLLVDFSSDDVDAAGLGLKPEANSFPSIWSTQSDSLPGAGDSVFSAHSASADLSAELSVPYEDIVQLEWLSTFVEDSFSGAGSLPITAHDHFHTSSPVSVLESSSSCSGGDKIGSPEAATAAGRRGRARSKRPRPATFNPRPAIRLSIVPTPASDSENFAESRPAITAPAEPKKKKKIKLSFPLAPAETNQSAAAVRKCMHCEITKTPQWRAGPLGPKTLCNACGVRFKSGRLFPEYRPAASPTFVPALHSNSHKKVLEMRGKGFDAASPELIPNTNNGISLEYM